LSPAIARWPFFRFDSTERELAEYAAKFGILEEIQSMVRILEAEKEGAIKRLHSITKDLADVRGLQRKALLEKDKAANDMRRKCDDPEVTSLTGNHGKRFEVDGRTGE
jgi:hypothetical protein